jgi:hypothetical protein
MSDDTRTGAENQDEGTQPGGSPSNAGEQNGKVKTYTQEEVNRLIEDRLSRAKTSAEKRTEKAQQEAVARWRDEHGLTDEAIQRLQGEDKATSDLRRIAKEKADLEKRHADLENRFGLAHARLVNDVTRAAVIAEAAKKSVDPESVYLHLKDRLKVEDDYSVTILGPDGEPAHGSEISDIVQELLNQKPFLARPTGEDGAGSRREGNGRKPAGPDLKTREGRTAALKSMDWG